MAEVAPKKPSTAVQQGKIEGFFIPSSEEDWAELSSARKLKNLTINNIPIQWLGSGSAASEAQYIMLRVYSPWRVKPSAFHQVAEHFGLNPQLMQSASSILSSSKEWNNYLKIVENGGSVDEISETNTQWPGSFAVTRRLQEQGAPVGGTREEASPTTRLRQQRPTHDAPTLGEAEDEAITNAAVVGMLQNLLQLTPSSLDWSISRMAVLCQLSTGGKFTAFTDGSLRSKTNKDTYIIIEAKKADRSRHPHRIQIQEACETACMLVNSSQAQQRLFSGHLVLISQDCDQLYFTFTKYQPEYHEYLRNGTQTSQYLVMQTIGPFGIFNAEQMIAFGRIMVAAMLLVNDFVSVP